MEIDVILKEIPNSLASFYDTIYVFNNSSFYSVLYNGFELKVSKEKTYNELLLVLDEINEDIKNDVVNNNGLKRVYNTKDGKEKLLLLDNINEYKVIYMIDITKNVSSDKKMLLIADDSPVITKFFTKIFQDEYEVLVANDGNEAIELIEEYKDKNLLGFFCDLQMPNKNGYEVLEYFKENNLFASIPVSIISGEDSADGIEKATAYGIVDMLQKPFNADSAKAIVNKTIGFSPKI